jgi:hypothetical protein
VSFVKFVERPSFYNKYLVYLEAREEHEDKVQKDLRVSASKFPKRYWWKRSAEPSLRKPPKDSQSKTGDHPAAT